MSEDRPGPASEDAGRFLVRVAFPREQRRNPAPAERALWQEL